MYMETGIRLLIKKIRDDFRQENKQLYSEEDYREAEKKYIKLNLNGDGKTDSHPHLISVYHSHDKMVRQ